MAHKNWSYFYYLLFGLLVVYNFVRSMYVPVVHDEAATFFHYIKSENFVPFYAHWDANNHFLNSFLAFISYKIWGCSAFAIRLPNSIFFIYYLYFTYQLSKEIKNQFIQFLFIVSLVLPHYLVEFFSVCRGYGISLAFLMSAIYFLKVFFEKEKSRFLFYSLLSISLATAANLTFVNTLLGILFLVGLKYISSKKIRSTKNLAIIILTSLIPLIFFVCVGLALKKLGLLYYGDLTGFWNLTVHSLIEAFTGKYYGWVGILIIFYFIIFLGMLVFNYYKTKKINVFDFKNVWSALFLVNLLITLLMGHVLKTNFPEDRTGIYFYPLFIGGLFFYLDGFNATQKHLKYILLPVLLFPIHFICSINASHHSFWYKERLPQDFFNRVELVSQKTHSKPTVSGRFMHQLTWAFESLANHRNLNQIQISDYPSKIADFVILREEELLKYPKGYHTAHFDTISRNYLLERDHKQEKKLIYSLDTLYNKILKDEYFSLYENEKLDTFINKNVLVELTFEGNGLNTKNQLFFIASTRHDSTSYNYYESMPFSWGTSNSDIKIKKSGMYIQPIYPKTQKMVVYLWNLKKDFYYIKRVQLSIYLLLDH